MTMSVRAALVMTVLWTAACGGGGNKPPMVPDQPGDPTVVGDAGVDVPAPSAPAPAQPANPH